MDGGVSAVGSIFNATWRIATVVYELKAVGEQTRDLLDTTSQVSSTLQHAQVLRRQRSGLLNVTEKKWIDDVLQASDKAVGNVAALIEPARVDMQTQCNKIRFLTRSQFILRDSPKVQVQLGRLGIAAQGLNTAMGVLCARDASSHASDGGMVRKIDSGPTENELRPPPSYEAVELLDRRRESVMRRRASKLPLPVNPDNERSKEESPGEQKPIHMFNAAEVQPTPMTSPQPESYTEIIKQKPFEEDPNPLPIVNVTEVLPTPMASPQPNRYAESDGLQVVENHSFWNSPPDLHSRGIVIYPYSTAPTTSAEHLSRSSFSSLPSPDPNYRPPWSTESPDPNYRLSRTHDQPPQPSWQQQRHSVHNGSPPPTSSSSSSNSYPPYRSPAQAPPHPPYNPNDYPPPTSTYNHTHNQNPNSLSHHPQTHPSSSTSPTLLSPTPTTTSPHPHSYFPTNQYNRPQSHSHSHSSSTTTLSPPTSTPLSPHPHLSLSHRASSSSIMTSESLSLSIPASVAGGATRPKGRDRGRAWLEHQAEKR